VVLAAGVITTTAQLAFEARLRIIYDGVHDLLIKYSPDVLILEDLYAEYKFPRTALLMAHARGVVGLAAEQCDVPVMALAPAEVKRAVAFNGAEVEQPAADLGRELHVGGFHLTGDADAVGRRFGPARSGDHEQRDPAPQMQPRRHEDTKTT